MNFKISQRAAQELNLTLDGIKADIKACFEHAKLSAPKLDVSGLFESSDGDTILSASYQFDDFGEELIATGIVLGYLAAKGFQKGTGVSIN